MENKVLPVDILKECVTLCKMLPCICFQYVSAQLSIMFFCVKLDCFDTKQFAL